MEFIRNRISRTAYSSDGSIYSLTPSAIAAIRTEEDIREAFAYAREHSLSITPRGGGTGLAGGALGEGLIIDFSDYRKIIKVDSDEKTVHTQVGIIYDELNMALNEYGLFFPPDPSSGDSCQVGGMLANNSSGPRSVKYGLTSHFVEELNVFSAAGRMLRLPKLKIGSDEQRRFFNEAPEYASVFELLKENATLIKERWPRLKKNSAGYNLLQVVQSMDRGIYDLPALIVGSEGTLAVITSAVLRLLPIPAERLTIRLYFKSLVEAGKAVEPILQTEPSGLEIVDGATLDLIGRSRFGIPSDAAALLLIEFDDAIEERRKHFNDIIRQFDLAGDVDYATDASASAALWKARKAIVPTLYRHHETRRPISLIEDVSLPPKEIPAFIEYITDLFSRYSLTFGIFGHIGDGNLHIRPLFDLNKRDEFELAQKIYDQVYEKVISVGGSSTAEHADGRLRAPVVRKIYGDDIYSVFVKIKALLDPENILSPGSVLSTALFTEKIDFEKIKSFCAACGKCNGYCPAYDFFRREDLSPRGWLRIINQSGGSYQNVKAYLQYCLNCKSCATVCPAGVDIAAEIIKFRSQQPTAMSKMAVALADKEMLLSLSLKLGQLATPLINSEAGKSVMQLFGKPLFGIDRSIQFPPIAKKPLRERMADRLADFGEVAFFHGCADNMLESNIGESLFKVFDKLGISLSIPEQKCCGLPYEVYGHHDNLINKARFNIDHLSTFNAVVTGCASCLMRLIEYEKLFDTNDDYRNKASDLAAKCFDISQYINKINPETRLFDTGRKYRVTYHNPCHLRAAGLQMEPEKLLKKFGNIDIIHPRYADRCCAQAGSYGFVHFQESKKMFEKKKEDYQKTGADHIVTSCPACQMKIRAEMGGNIRVIHPVEILAEMIK
ncbi:MAG: FAD-binding and (Fe-S)-binding domain-containing protein [Candidatus Zixiibacteriota bacterium]